MAFKLKIKKGATVQVITGSDKGKKGTVIEVDPTKLRVKVQGVKVQTHFDKKWFGFDHVAGRRGSG